MLGSGWFGIILSCIFFIIGASMLYPPRWNDFTYIGGFIFVIFVSTFSLVHAISSLIDKDKKE